MIGKRIWSRGRAWVFSVGTAAVLTASAGLARAEIVVAAAFSTTGGNAPQGLDYLHGTELAIDRLNRDGGVRGERLRLLVLDDACDADQAEAVAHRAVDDHPAVVIGHACSAASIRAAPIYAAAGILQITPASTNPKLTGMDIHTVFRLIGRDDRQGDVAAARIQRDWPKARLAVMDDGTTYGRGLGDAVRAGLARQGLTLTLSGGFPAGADNYRAEVAQLSTNRIGVVYLAGLPADIGLFVREIRAGHLNPVILSGDGSHGSVIGEIAGAASDDMHVTYAPDLTRGTAAAALLAELRARGVTMTSSQLRAYAAVEVWSAAVARAGSLDGAAVAAALRAGPIDSVIGPIAFDQWGDLTTGAGDWVWYRWHDRRTSEETGGGR